MQRTHLQAAERAASRVFAIILLLASCFVLAASGPSIAAPKNARQVVTQAPGSPMIPGSTPGSEATATTAAPTPADPSAAGVAALQAAVGIGICQCIADHTSRRLTCLSSAQECQSSCNSTHYSFVPHAVSCPLTPEPTSAAMSPAR